MKKLSFKNLAWLVAPLIVFIYFLPNLVAAKIPIPADSILGLYHPWRDESYSNYAPMKFPTKNPLITDPVLQTYPWRKIVINDFKNGILPFWNPYSFSGQPLLANIQSSPFQFANILFFILPFNAAWGLQIILMPLLAAFFMFLFLKSLGLSNYASAFGSVILPFSGFFVAWLTWGNIITTAMWLPFILFLINQIYQKPRVIWFIVLVFSLSQTILSGHSQTALYVYLAAALYVLFQQFSARKITSFLTIGLSVLIALLICMPQILPAYEFIAKSARELDQGFYPGRQDWFLPLQNLIMLVSPDFFGNPATYNYWGIWNYAEFISYTGLIPLFMALLAITIPSRKKNFFLVLIFVSLLLAIQNPISKFIYVFKLPFVDSLQPSRIIFLLVFSLAGLAAFGLDDFLKTKSNVKTVAVAILLVIPVLVLMFVSKFDPSLFPAVNNLNVPSIAFHNLLLSAGLVMLLLAVVFLKLLGFPKKAIVFLIFAVSVFDLFRFAYKFTPFAKFSEIFPQTQITSFLQKQSKPFRILATDRRIFNGNSSIPYGVETVQGYDPIYLLTYADLVTAWDSNKISKTSSFNRIVTPQNYASPLTNLLNVKYVATFDEINDPAFKKVAQKGQTKIYENTSVFPRVFFAKEVVKTNSAKDTLKELVNAKNNLETTAFSSDFSFPSQNLNASAQITKYNNQSMTIKTVSNKTAPLVISNVNYPGWEAKIDNKTVDLKKVDYLLQALIVPSGTHEIDLGFYSKSFAYGLYLCILGLALTLGAGIVLWKKQRQL